MQLHFTFDTPVVKKCPKCNVEKPGTIEYFSQDSRRKNGLQTYCKVCQSGIQREYFARMAEGEGVPLTCEWCHQEFRVPPKRSEGRRFCSNSCKAHWYNHKRGHGRLHKVCDRCGTEFSVNKSKYDGKSRFCSDKCRLSWFTEFSRQTQCGENNPYWNFTKITDGYYGPTWRSARASARKRDNHTCQRCGITSKELGYRLVVHHIKPFAQFGVERHAEANQIDNLVSYCRSCHLRVEWQMRSEGS